MKVSVSIVTYNHERFIAKALDSVLMQKTNFDFEILVGEDCSTDNTRNILIDYDKRFPGKFRLFLNEKNLGMHANGGQLYEACQSEYVAMLEGDDYWTAPDKLQKQVDFLDTHPECTVCFHDALIVHEDGSEEPVSYRPGRKEFYTVEDLLLDNFIPTCSVMFRRGVIERIPDWITALKMGDWPFYILCALKGKIACLPETMAVYVVHRGGVWSMRRWQDHALAIIDFFEALAVRLPAKYAGMVNRILRWRHFELSERYENADDLAGARTHARKSLGKHLLILSGQMRPGAGGDAHSMYPLPDYIESVESTILRRKYLRLCVLPKLETYIPSLYRFLRAGAHRLNLGI